MAAGGTLAINGALWVGCGAANGTSGSHAGSYGTMTNNGGALKATSTGINPGNGSVTSSALLVINGGTNNLGTVSVKRSSGTSSFPHWDGWPGNLWRHRDDDEPECRRRR